MLRFIDEDDDAGFVVVPDRSYVIAVIHDLRPNEVAWTIHVEWHNPEIDEHSFRDAIIEIADVSFGAGDCRRLEGREAHVAFQDEDVHPIMPGNPANFYYFAQHHVPNQNRIRIVSCNGPDLEIHWSCLAEVMAPPGTPLEIIETVAFRKVVVAFTMPDKPNLDNAWKIALTHFDKAQLGEPGVHGNAVEFPIRMPRVRAAATPPKRMTNPEPDEPAVAELRKFGVKVKRDKTLAGNPVVGVEFGGKGAGNEAVEILASLPLLRRVSLHGATITDAGLTSLRGLIHLESLSIGGRPKINNAGLENLRTLSALEHLHIDNCDGLTDDSLELLSTLTRLQSLDLYGGQFTDAGAVHLEKLTNLRRLTLAGSRIGDAGLTHLRGMLRLEYVNLGGTRITDVGLTALQGLGQLRHLNAASTNLTDAALRILGTWPQLERLGLPGTKITNAGLLLLRHLPNLQLLFLSNTKVTQAGADALRKLVPRVRVLL